MSTIDQLIAKLVQTGAERLVLVSGKQPVLTVNGQAEPVPEESEAIDRVGLEGMILLMGDDAEPGQRQMQYEAPTGTVDVTVRVTDRVIQLIIVPESAATMSDPVGEDPEPVAEYEEPDDVEDTSWSDTPAALEGDASWSDAPGASDVDTSWASASSEEVLDADEVEPEAQPASGFDGAYAFGAEVQHFGSDDDAGESSEKEWFDPSALSEDFEGVAEADASTAATVMEVDPVADSPIAGLPMIEDEPEARPAVETRLAEVAPDPEPRAAEEPAVAPAPPDRPRQALEVRDDAPAMERLFLKMVENGCSDLHVSAGSAPLFRKDGRISDLGGEPVLSPRDTEALLNGITPERYRKQFEERNDTDFAYEITGVARFRCNLFRDRKGMGGVFRQIPTDILTAQQLGLREQLLDLCQLKKGLVLVTGPTGSGKSTTLAALIDHINQTREDHIITIEDPIEFVHENKKCLINQREVGEHTESFKVALRAALREDPDIVLVGELRDLETVEIALETAETGHLVFGTLHTNTAPGTVSRLIDQFPSGQQAQIRTMLADTLKGVIAQTLCRKAGGGRVAALEVLVVNNAVANLIREDKAYQIPSAMQTGRAQGMNTLNDALLDLVQRSVVSPQEAYWNAVDKPEFATILGRNGIKLEGVVKEAS